MSSSLASLLVTLMQIVPSAGQPPSTPSAPAPPSAQASIPSARAAAPSATASSPAPLVGRTTTPGTSATPSLQTNPAAGSPSSTAPSASSPTPGSTPPPQPDNGTKRIVTLEDAERMAERYQPLIRQARANTRAAQSRIEEARSGALPQVTGTAQYQLTTGNFAPSPGLTVNTNPPPASWKLYNFYNFGLSATQLIYDFGLTHDKWRAAEASADSYQATERTTENQTRFSVHSAFFTARAQKALVKVAEDTLANQMKHLGQTQGFVQAGTHPEIDLASVRTDVANAQVQLITAQNAYDVARVQLNQAMGLMTDTNYDVADETMPQLAEEEWPLDRLLERAYAARPELASLVKGRDAQELTIASAKGGYGPSIQATASATERGLALDALGPNASVGVLLTWPLLQGGLTQGLVHEAEANLDVVQAQLDAEKLQVKLDVEQAYLAVRAAKASIQASQDALVNSREQLRLAEGRYGSGIGNVVELGDAQVALTAAAAQRVQNDYTLSTARAQLVEALGQR